MTVPIISRNSIALFFAVALVVGGLLIFRWLTPDGAPALRLSDLPTGAILLSQGETWPSDASHPLGQLNVEETWPAGAEALLAYRSAQKLSALLPNQGVTVATYAYAYASIAQARRAAEVLAEYLRNETGVYEGDAGPEEAGGIRGQGILLAPSEEDASYWFVGAKAKTLFLLIVDGTYTQMVLSAADAVMSGLD